jgi:maltooligosyltrehalose trehalohydrolase
MGTSLGWSTRRGRGCSTRSASTAARPNTPTSPHGPSEVVDPDAFAWTDASWRGVRLPGQVIYEMHVGTFTGEGTWTAAAAQLPPLAELGVMLLEVMPVAEFSGRFGLGV